MKEKIYDEINLGILKHVGSGLKILDVGCGTGLLGYEMRKIGNYVYGIDISKKELAFASKRLDRVKNIDITKDKFDLPKDFDIIIFSDVLEHLKDPLSCLKNFKTHLKPGGKIIISLPNIACYNVRLGLLFGKFNYQKYGALDDTHLRFFTKSTSKQMVRDSDFEITEVSNTPYIVRPIFRFFRIIFSDKKKETHINKVILNSKYFKFYKNYIFPIENFLTKFWPSLLAYQFIIVAKK